MSANVCLFVFLFVSHSLHCGVFTVNLVLNYHIPILGSQSVAEKVDEIKKHVKEIADKAKVRPW